MREYGLIGYPLTHSFSQKYFTQKFERGEISDAVFYTFSIPSIDELPVIMQEHPLLKGLAVTIPYKRAVLKYLSESSPAVKEMLACNCVKIDGKNLSGFNTDVIGFEKSFIQHLQPQHKNALILGTGGGASAVEYVLRKTGMDYNFVSRHADKEKGILGYDDLTPGLMQKYTVIINCTPVGMYPNVQEAPDIPYDLITSRHYLFDLIYNPPLSKFLESGAEQNAIIQNGYEMLVLQAEENWRIWNDESFES
jgi:shikimate dehydrogenase